jgi:glycosyltransferase involved in cell wall biosynthesis
VTDVVGRLAGRLAGHTIVIGSERNADYRPRTRHKIAYALTRFGLDLLIANSNAGARFSSRVFHNPFSKYRVVHNGVDTARFVPGDGGQTGPDRNRELLEAGVLIGGGQRPRG